MGKILAASLGITAEDITWKETISDNREPFLQNGEVDLVIASYSITDDRRKIVGQAGPYYVTGQQLLVKKGSDIKSVDDVKGKEVCSVTGSTSLDNIEAKGAKPRGFDTYSECRDQVAQRQRRLDDHRRRDPAGLRRRGPRRPRGRRRPVLRGALRRRLLQGQPGDVPVDHRHDQEGRGRRHLGEGLRGDPRQVRAWTRPSRRPWTPAPDLHAPVRRRGGSAPTGPTTPTHS